jgi:hypothetical protein
MRFSQEAIGAGLRLAAVRQQSKARQVWIATGGVYSAAQTRPHAPGHEKPGHEKGPTETVEPEQAETGLFYDRRPGIRWVAGLPAVCGQACQNPNNPSDIFDGFQHWPSFLIGPPSCRSAKAGAAEIKAAIATVAAAIVN